MVNLNNGNGTIGGRYINAVSAGGPGEIPIVGDFNGDGYDNLGVYRPVSDADAWTIHLNAGNGTG
jgi:hypothetical protein